MSLASILKRISKTFWDKAGDTVTSQVSEVHKYLEHWHAGKVTAGETVKGAEPWKTGFSITEKNMLKQ